MWAHRIDLNSLDEKALQRNVPLPKDCQALVHSLLIVGESIRKSEHCTALVLAVVTCWYTACLV